MTSGLKELGRIWKSINYSSFFTDIAIGIGIVCSFLRYFSHLYYIFMCSHFGKNNYNCIAPKYQSNIWMIHVSTWICTKNIQYNTMRIWSRYVCKMSKKTSKYYMEYKCRTTRPEIKWEWGLYANAKNLLYYNYSLQRYCCNQVTHKE